MPASERRLDENSDQIKQIIVLYQSHGRRSEKSCSSIKHKQQSTRIPMTKKPAAIRRDGKLQKAKSVEQRSKKSVKPLIYALL
jgi:hypothetical protein